MPHSILRQSVFVASQRHEVVEAVRTIYATLQEEIDQRRPRCDMSGRCCHFDAFGHRLYVTTIELAAFVRALDATPEPRTGACPFLQNKLCGVHAIRPFGCRIFFCDPTATRWQQEKYEAFHNELKRLHDTFCVPYHYMEWLSALSELGLAGEAVEAVNQL